MKTNKYKLNKLRQIINIIKTINVDDTEEFDYLRIISIKNIKIDKNAKNILFFPIVLDKKYVEDGWIEKEIDLKTPINEIIEKFPQYTFVIEKDMVDKIRYKYAKLIVVDNIMNSVNMIYNYQIENNKFKTIAVTGSAGKTTTVGVIEKVLENKYNILRIYSDRITPIVLKSYIINFLSSQYNIIALEMGIYYGDHVKKLSELLNPNVSVIINIGTAHLGNKGLESCDKICINKSFILKNAELGIINGDDSHLELLKLIDGNLYYNENKLFKTKLGKLERVYPKEIKVINNKMLIKGNLIDVPVLTELSALQYLIAYNIGKYFNIDEKDIVKSLNNFKSVENRLNRIKIFDKEVIFDGDSSFKERIHQVSNHLYKEAYLVLRKYGATYYNDDFAGIGEYFKKFNKVYLFNDIKYLNELKNYPNVEIVSNHDFLKNLKGEVFYHYHDYYYTFDKVNEKYLK